MILYTCGSISGFIQDVYASATAVLELALASGKRETRLQLEGRPKTEGFVEIFTSLWKVKLVVKRTAWCIGQSVEGKAVAVEDAVAYSFWTPKVLILVLF